MVIVVRQVTKQEVDAVVEVWERADQGGGAERRLEVERALTADPDLLLVAEVDGRLAGVILGTCDGHRGYPKRIVVLPDCRQCGIGRALVRELERRFVSRGIYRMNVTIRAENNTSQAFSSTLGYAHEPGVMVWVKTLRPSQP